MTSLTADTIILDRQIAAHPDRVFQAWADAEERVQWDVPGENWVLADFEHDFRPDGIERSQFGPAGNPVAESYGRYLVIEPGRCFVVAGVIKVVKSGAVRSALMMTIELTPEQGGTRLRLIDQSIFMGPAETAAMRRAGWTQVLDRLDAYLARAA